MERVRLNPYIPWAPTVKQAAFLCCDAPELLYGGAAGGAKSVALLMAALEYAPHPGYHALLLRRTFQDLNKPEGLIPLSHQFLHETDASWNGNDHRWSFPNGSTLDFGYLATATDIYQYQGAAYQFVGFDELTQFTEEQYTYLFSRMRRKAASAIPIRMRSASNPGGLGHDWVFKRFFVERSPERVFIEAKLEDNPYLDREQYERELDRLDPVTQRQLRHGDWTVRPSGGWFEASDLEIVDEVPVITKAVRYWDMAASEARAGLDPDYTAGCLLGRGGDGNYYVLDVRRFREAPATSEQILRQVAWTDSSTYNVTIWLEQEPGASGVIAVDHLIRDVLVGQSVFADKKDAHKNVRAAPVAAQVARGAIKVVRAPWNTAFINELVAFPNPKVHDDQVDALSGAFAKLTDPGMLIYSPGAEPARPPGWEGYSLEAS